MDRLVLIDKLMQTIKKYRYVLIVVAAGILLMLLPGKQDAQGEAAKEVPTAPGRYDITQALTQILEQVQGAGRVEVLLTIAAGETTVYQQDTDISGGDNGSVRKETVIITDGDRNQSGLIQQITPPVYQGAIIVCQGADNDVVRLHIIQAVAKVTGLGTDKITVLKMK